MQNVEFHHLKGRAHWLESDHFQTALTEEGEVRLATAEEASASGLDDAQSDWEASGGAVFVDCSPDACRDDVLLVDPERGLRRIDSDSEEPWPMRQGDRAYNARDGGLVFEPAHPSPRQPTSYLSVTSDSHGRIWLLCADRNTIEVYAGHDFRRLDTIHGPPVDIQAMSATENGLVAIAPEHALGETPRAIWRMPFGQSWRAVDTGEDDANPVAIDAAKGGPAAVVCRHQNDSGGFVVFVDGDRVAVARQSVLEAPGAILCTGPDTVLIAEGYAERRTRFGEFRRDTEETGHLVARQTWQIKGFDGRALLYDPASDTRWASTARGLRRLYVVRDAFASFGVVETVQLDSERFGCQWHRVFVDCCVPDGTAIELEARCSDEPYPAN